MNTKNGIWSPYKAFYVEAMLFNARSAVVSIERVGAAIDALAENASGDLSDHE